MTQESPRDYDPATWVHYLVWCNKCLGASPQEFQSMFEKVASRVWPDFVPIRPYGRLGDRKCDGWRDGTVFQVYSPDEIKLQETRAKIEEDLAGAVEYWGTQLKEWVFVYNIRRGVPADVIHLLHQQEEKYPDIAIKPLSSEALWELILGLNPQKRAEILGAPPGCEHVFLSPAAESEGVGALAKEGWLLVVHGLLSSINISDAAKALEPRRSFGPPFYVRPPFTQESWDLTAEHQAVLVHDLLEKGRHLVPRFAVFSLSPIPLAIHLGYLLSDRVEVLPFQYDRDRKTWCWDTSLTAYDDQFQIEGLPTERVDSPVQVTIRVSLSALIHPEESVAAAGECPIQIDLRANAPDVMWLSHPDQLVSLGREFRELLKAINRLVPRCRQIHLFYAGPTGGAVVIGQAINPRMNPPVALYQYDRRKEPSYERVLTLR